MRTHILYIDEDEKHRGTLPDCLCYMESNATHYGDHHFIIIIPMIPRNIKWQDLTQALKNEAVGQMCYEDRLAFNKDLEKEYGE